MSRIINNTINYNCALAIPSAWCIRQSDRNEPMKVNKGRRRASRRACPQRRRSAAHWPKGMRRSFFLGIVYYHCCYYLYWLRIFIVSLHNVAAPHDAP